MELERLTIDGGKIFNSKGKRINVTPLGRPKVMTAFAKNVEYYRPESADACIIGQEVELIVRGDEVHATTFYIAVQYYKILK